MNNQSNDVDKVFRNDLTHLAFEYASEFIKDDREVVLEAVKKNAWVLRCASEELQNDLELKKLAQG